MAVGMLAWGINTGTAHAQAALFDFEDVAATWNDPNATPPGPNARPGTYWGNTGSFFGNPLVVTKNGVKVTIIRFLDTHFDVVFNANRGPGNNQGDKPASWGNKSLDPFFDIQPSNIDTSPPPPNQGNKITAGASAYWLFAFSSAVEGQVININSVSLDFGDYGDPTPGAADSDTGVLRLFASSASDAQGDTPIGFGTAFNPSTTFPGVTSQTVSAIAPTGNVRLATFESITNNGPADNSVFLDNLFINFTAVTVPEPGTIALLAPVLLTGFFAVRRRKQ